MTTEAELLKRAYEMRRNPTEPEKRRWRVLSNSHLGGFKFRRQHVVYEAQAIIDLFCPAIGLCIEVDGDTHDAQDDARRDQRLAAMGRKIIRFSNTDAMSNPAGLAEVILATATSLPKRWEGSRTAPTPPLTGRGLKSTSPPATRRLE